MQFKSLLFFASVITLAFGTTPQNVLDDLASLKTSVTTLDNAIKAFANPGGTLAQALTIHNDATSTKSVTDTAATDAQGVTPKPVSESDGNAILTAVNGIKPLIEDALTQIVAKKPAFEALTLGGVPALVKADLAALGASTDSLANALIAASPADLVTEGTAIKNEIDAAFATAAAAYADA